MVEFPGFCFDDQPLCKTNKSIKRRTIVFPTHFLDDVRKRIVWDQFSFPLAYSTRIEATWKSRGANADVPRREFWCIGSFYSGVCETLEGFDWGRKRGTRESIL